MPSHSEAPALPPPPGSPPSHSQAVTPSSGAGRFPAWAAMASAIAACALARVLAFPFTDNLYGDAVVRTEIAQRWLAAPRLIASFKDLVYQFGPLHTYYLAAFLKLVPDREAAGRLGSLLVGVLTAVPTFRLTRRLFGKTAAIWASLAFAAWGLHIQSSTTAGSEALALLLFACAADFLFAGLEAQRFGPLAASALCLNLACATRYDMWMYVPLFTLVVAVWGEDRIAAVTRAVMFAGLAMIFPLLWMEGNERAMGDPLYPIHYIDDFHRRWTQDGIAWLGKARMRLWGSVFWPGTLLLTLSPLYGLLCFAGIARAFKRREKRALAVLAALPSAYYTFRAAVLLDFSPLARFTMPEVFLCIPYAYDGFAWLTGRWRALPRRALAGFTALLALATPAYVAALSYGVDAGWGHTLKPVSPVTTMPADQMQVARWLRDQVQPPDVLLVDADDAYTDVGVAFYSGLPESRLVRARWDDFADRVRRQHPREVVIFDKGMLQQRPEVKLEGEALTAFGARYALVQSFEGGRFRVYRAR